jgi:propionyl-CoA carboxylase alpha chain
MAMRLPRKILIANRGEVVVRIARTCREMGIATVAVYSDADRLGLHPSVCDEAVHLPGSAASETYLRSDLLVAAAQRTDAEAVHPGFGFLAEDAAFAQAVTDAGLTWIGPSAEVIARMGDKVAAKKAMAAAGVPLLPSVSLDEAVDEDALLDVADEVGFPLMVKAVAGGGGKGMRVVREREGLPEAVAAARREAESSFGDERLFLERYVGQTRHLEVQVLGDVHGNVVHLFERECSIQRRHQKVIEETPSPAIDDEVRAGLCHAAVAAAQAIGYVNAGTVEFVANERLLARRRAGEPVDPKTAFAFLEVNTRLQVEHPVTEEVVRVQDPVRWRTSGNGGGGALVPVSSGHGERIDLVRLQILVAAGVAVPFLQDEVVQRGHAIEARLYAEDPAAGYLPSTGRLDVFAPDPSVRWDVGVVAGDDVTHHYDPMVAKAVAHAPTRDEAAAKLAGALARTPVVGVATNQDLLLAILDDPAFRGGQATTAFLEDRDELLLAAPDQALVDRAAMCVALHDALRRHGRDATLPRLPIAFAPSDTFEPSIVLDHDEPVTVRYRQARSGAWRVRVARKVDPDGWLPLVDDEEAEDVEVVGHGADHLDIEVAGHRTGARVIASGTTRLVATEGRWVRFELAPRLPTAREASAPGSSTAPMPGKVTSLAVEVGDVVDVGATLLTVEAMKMEHRLTAQVAGSVTDVRVSVGDQVTAEQVVVVIDEGSVDDADA